MEGIYSHIINVGKIFIKANFTHICDYYYTYIKGEKENWHKKIFMSMMLKNC